MTHSELLSAELLLAPILDRGPVVADARDIGLHHA
jgi:hypothetical protein